MAIKRLLGAALSLFAVYAWGAGPATIAIPDRTLWPERIDSVAGYNYASRAEILLFVGALGEVIARDEATLKSSLRIKSVDRASVQRVYDRLLLRLLNNFVVARSSCLSGELLCEPVTTVPTLLDASHKLAERLPATYNPWLENAGAFHRTYATELVRLAALFPNVTSEVDTFGPSERSGFELPDGHFLWTFDDGPTASGGTTDSLLAVLDRNGIHGMFYVLGERVKKRVQATPAPTLQKMYSGQCLALHGWVHESHQRMEQWQSSVVDTQKLVRETWPDAYRPYFRPPYGQRRNDSGPFFKGNSLAVALWNIDSQDWNAKISEHDAAQRVLTLMLLWRSGVILFHDVHSKAIHAVPWLVEQTRKSGISWDDCRSY